MRIFTTILITFYMLTCLVASKPNTSNPNATKEAKCILGYLYSLNTKPEQKVISGQYTNVALNIDTAFNCDIAELYNKTGKWVGIIGVDYQRTNSGLPGNMHQTNKKVIEYFKSGGLVTMYCSFSNPWTGKGFNDTTGRYQIMDIIDSSKAVNKEWLRRLDSVAIGLKELQDSGVVVLYRLFPENNGNWFWWGSQSSTLPTQENWVKLWKYSYNYLTHTKKLNNILWVFAPSAKEPWNKNPAFKPDLYYYPGDAFVDIVGTSVYSDTLDIPSYEQLKATGKPIALTEFGPGYASKLTKNFDYCTLIRQIKSKYPDFRYWVSWNDFVTNGGKDTVYYSPENHKNGRQLLEDNWVINKNDINWPDSCTGEENKPVLLEPEDGRVYHAACLMTYETSGDPIGPYLNALNDSTIQPAARGFFITIPGERGPANSFKGLQNFFHTADSVGFIPEVSLFFMDKQGSTDSIIAVSNTHDWIIDSIITLSKNYGKKMFMRIGGEFNGKGEGWNGGGYHPYYYVQMFRKIVDRYEARSLRDSIAVIWCYEPDADNDFDSVGQKGYLWYPGDEYADWFGLDVFNSEHFDQSLPDYDNRGITKKGKSERFLAMARQKNKPVYMSETSAKGINISLDNSDGINDWNNWFAKFWDFIDKHKEIKGFTYINANWPKDAYPGWGDARIQNNAYVTSKYVEEMKKSKYIHLKQFVPQVNGPWNNPLMIARSTDGINFTDSKVFQDSSGVPCVIKWKGDTLACVFQWFGAPVGSATWDKVAVKFSYNKGNTWTEPKPIIVKNLPANYQRPFDPTITNIEGNKIRIYFSSSEGIPSGLDTAINTYSAVSNDGVIYEFEPGAGYDNKLTRVIDPAVAYFKNQWHYLSPIGAPQDGAYHCTSADGVNFAEETKINSDNTHNWTGNFTVENDNELRFYGCGPEIWYNKSSDGFNWGPYTKTNLNGGDPSVAKLAGDSYIIVYVGSPIRILPPPKVTLLIPQNNSQISANKQILTWYSFKNIQGYHLQVSFNNRFNQFVVNDSTVKDTLYTLTNLIPDSVYYWKVRAENSAGWGDWSDVWRFRYKKGADSIFSATPVTEMGKSLYKTFPGGLYPNTSNERPEIHNNDGIELANSVIPLNINGEPDAVSGKIVLLSVGMSNTTQEYSTFKTLTDTFKLKNRKLEIVDGAQGGQTASIIKNTDAGFWKIIDTVRLRSKGLTNLQVQAVWLKEANSGPTQQFPTHASMLKDDLKAVVRVLVQKYPNLKLVYISSRTYGGYANTQLNPEPYAYESGFSVKWLIEEQINGDDSLEYRGSKRVAPWLSWGPYLWANGPNPREDGLVWLNEDFGSDGTHPSDKGRLKASKLLLEFFSTDETTVPWFLEGKTGVVSDLEPDNLISLYPNPARDFIELKSPCECSFVRIYNAIGECVWDAGIPYGSTILLEISHLAQGAYYLKCGSKSMKFMKIE